MATTLPLRLTLAQADDADPRPQTPGDKSQPAQTQEKAPPKTSEPGGQQDSGAAWPPLIMVGGLLVVMYLLFFLPQRRQRKKHNEMLANLKKNDRVQTIGGVIGTVADIRDNEIVVKVDEANNTRMRFARSAIQNVVSDQGQTQNA